MYAQLDLKVICKKPKKGRPSNFHDEEINYKKMSPEKKNLTFDY
jgi:hypothetical protein